VPKRFYPIASYNDCRDAFERALASPTGGISVAYETVGQAIRFRARCHYYRNIVRRSSMEIYPPDSPLHGVSPYDGLVLRILDSAKTVVRFEPVERRLGVIEEI
jgi:hypothetical protein